MTLEQYRQLARARKEKLEAAHRMAADITDIGRRALEAGRELLAGNVDDRADDRYHFALTLTVDFGVDLVVIVAIEKVGSAWLVSFGRQDAVRWEPHGAVTRARAEQDVGAALIKAFDSAFEAWNSAPHRSPV